MFPDSFQIGQLKNDTRFSEGVNLDSASALNDLQTEWVWFKPLTHRQVWSWFVCDLKKILLPKPVKHNPCPAADFNSII